MKRGPWVGAGLVIGLVVLAAAGGHWWRNGPLELPVVTATRGPAIEAVYATGLVEPTLQIPVSPRSGGRLVQLLVEEGQAVRRGQPLAHLQAAELEQSVQELVARERLAGLQAERTRALVAEKFLSRAELDRVEAELAAAGAARRRAEAQRDDMRLAAPVDGTVLRRDGEVGQLIGAGQVILTLAGRAPLRVSAEVDEEDIVRLRPGLTVALRSEALPGRVFDAVLAEITPRGDPASRSWRVRIRLAAPAEFEAAGARSGMTMDANIVTARREGALLLPARALIGPATGRDGAREVWVLDAQDRLQRRTLKLGVQGADKVEVLAGLDEAECVLLPPAEAPRGGLREGRAIRPQAETAVPAAAVMPAASVAR